MNQTTGIKIGAAYIRVSTDDQTELSPSAQLREIKKTAGTDKIVIPKEYIFIEEKGVSGRRADNRKQFQKMISIAKSQPSPFEYLYVWKFSRFARNQEESVFYKSVLRKKCGVTIKSVSEPIMEGMFGRLIESIIEWFDEYYSVNLSGEVTRGMTEKALRNGYQSAPCLGYKAAGHGKPFLLVEEEYRIVEYLHQSYYDGMDLSAIAREANRLGFLTKRGSPFDRRSVERILKNKFYTGTVTWKDITFQGTHETRKTVTSLFDSNQMRLTQNIHPQNRREVSSCRHWASGLIQCGYCGAGLSYNKGSPSGRPACFQCWKYTKGLQNQSCSITVKKAEHLIQNSLREVVSSKEFQYKLKKQDLCENEKEITRLKTALSKNEMKLQKLRNAYESGVDNLEEYGLGKERLNLEKQELKQNLIAAFNRLKLDNINKKENVSSLKTVSSLLSDPAISSDIKGNALRSVIKKIVYKKEENKFQVYYYLDLP
ncbi:recombinase family protein [Clostridium sp. E02]|uniref:recombinase family protein n=1 Tax=Clostridium sp. E02 TaxID=2487134 RepID=UPI000F5474EC|nr:recombinase family protein [Clostridium sp. E02]